MVKAIHQGLAKPGDPIYKQGWTLYMGPQQKRPSETPSEGTPPKPSEKTAEGHPAVEAESRKEKGTEQEI